MKRLSLSAIIVVSALGLTGLSACKGPGAGGAGAGSKEGGAAGQAANDPARKERVLANLTSRYPRLNDLKPSLGDFTRVAPGMDEVVLTLTAPQGTQNQKVLVTADDKSAYIVLEGPIDISKNAQQLAEDKAKQVSDRKDELTKVASGHPVRGNPNAKVTIIEFSDFQCPYCKSAASTVEEVLKKYPNDVKLVYVNYPLPFHPWAKPAAVAAVCAAKQDPKAFWKLYDWYFANQKDITPQNVVDKTQQQLAGTGVDVNKWKKCAADTSSPDNQDATKTIDASMATGGKLGVQGTPAFFINGEFLNGAVPMDQFDAAVKKAMGG